MNWRAFCLVSHRWLGLAASLVLAVVGLTGALMVWRVDAWWTRAAGRLHESLALGRPGAWVVYAATWAALVLQATGVFLWWRRKVLRVRSGAGWKTALSDVHHVAGIAGLVPMLVLAATAAVMSAVTPEAYPTLRPMAKFLHTGEKFGTVVKVIYALASLGFLAQGLSGVVMWWPRRARR